MAGAAGSAIKGNEQQQRRTEVDLFFMESLTVCENESSREKELHPGGMAPSLSSPVPSAGVIG